MKRIFCLALVLALCAAMMAACKKAAPEPADAGGPMPAQPEVTAVPEEGDHGEEDQSAALADMPTLEPVVPLGEDAGEAVEGGGTDDYYSIDALLADVPDEAPAPQPEPVPEGEGEPTPTPRPVVDTSTYQYSALTDTSLGFTFNYPSHWENVPGVYTVCFREKVEPGDFPARVAITAKKLVHTPDEQVITEELTSYLRMVHKQYEAASFQAGTPSTEETFLGKPAMSNTYLAYSGENEVKGYIIGTAVGRTMYVLHFCATYDDYGAMESMMRYMVKSAELVDQEQ